MTPNELRTAADDLDRLKELEPRPGRVWLADRLRRGAEWLEAPPWGMVEAAAEAIFEKAIPMLGLNDRIHVKDIWRLAARAALVAAARWEAPA